MNALVPFIAAGLEQGQRCVYLASDAATAGAVRALERAGVDVTQACSSGSLCFRTDRSSFVEGTGFDPAKLLSHLTATAEAAARSHHSALRLAVEMAWVLGAASRADALIEFEAGVHESVAGPPWLAILQYDRGALPAEIVRDVILTHGTVGHGQSIYHNPRAVPPREFLGRDREAHEVDVLLDVLDDQKTLLDAQARRAEIHEARHRSIISALHEGVILQDASGRVLTWNPAAERIFGISAEDALEQTSTSRDWGLFTKEDRPLAGEDHPSMQTVRTGRPCTDVVLRLRRTDGQRRWVSVNTAPIWEEDEAGRRVAAVAISFDDITQRRLEEQTRREREALLAGVFDAMPSGCAVYQVRNDGASGSDYIIRFFNTASLAIEGMTLEEVLGKSLADLRPTIDDYGLIPVFQRVWKTGEPAVFPARIYVDKHYANYYENRVFRLPSGEIVAIYDDVTERERTLEALRASEETWRSYVDDAPYGVFIADAAGHYLQVNPEACRITGYSEPELLAMSIADLLPPDDLDVGLAHFGRLLSEGRSSGVAPLITKLGEHRWWSVSAVKLSDDRFLGFTADVTDKVVAEAEVAELNAASSVACSSARPSSRRPTKSLSPSATPCRMIFGLRCVTSAASRTCCAKKRART